MLVQFLRNSFPKAMRPPVESYPLLGAVGVGASLACYFGFKCLLFNQDVCVNKRNPYPFLRVTQGPPNKE